MSSIKMKLAPNCVKFRMISLMDGLEHPRFCRLDKTHLRMRSENGINYIDIPVNILGKEVIFFKNHLYHGDNYPYVLSTKNVNKM